MFTFLVLSYKNHAPFGEIGQGSAVHGHLLITPRWCSWPLKSRDYFLWMYNHFSPVDRILAYLAFEFQMRVRNIQP
jgi:hypothetical protein